MAGNGSHISMPDQDLVLAIRNGAPDACNCLFERHYAGVVQFLSWRTSDAELAADLAQQTFWQAFRDLNRLEHPCHFAAWLYGIARNQLLMHWRRQQLRRYVSLSALSDQALWSIPALCLPAPDDDCDERDLVSRVLADLSPAVREVLVWHGVVGYTASEVAQILCIRIGAAERRISRAKQQFRVRYCELSASG